MITEEQRARRLSGVYGSDAAIILGKSKRMTPYELWEIKTKRKEAPDLSHLDFIQEGNYFEPGILKWYADNHLLPGQLVAVAQEEITHKDNSWMRGHPDAYVTDGQNKLALIEVKFSRWGQAWEDNQIPYDAYFQAHHYLTVSGLERLDFAICVNGIFNRFTLNADKNLSEILTEIEYRFWHHNVLTDTPPEPYCLDDVKIKYPVSQPGIIDTTPDISNALNKLITTKAAIKALEADKEKLQTAICAYMGINDTLISDQGEIIATWKSTKDGKTLDTDRFKKEAPELYEQYLKDRKGYRVLRTKGE